MRTIPPPSPRRSPGPARRPAAAALLPSLALAGLLFGAGRAVHGAETGTPTLRSYTVQAGSAAPGQTHEARVEALRQTTLAAQVAGAIVELRVRPGDTVQAGQLLMRLDARSADQSAQASEAQTQVARAQLELARRERDRQQQLFRQRFISQAALDQAEAQFAATEAQVQAQLAQAGAARSQSAWYQLRAPYAGVIAEVPVVQGDMALPGRSLAVLYDPSALRVTAHVPQAQAQALMATQGDGSAVLVDLPTLGLQGQIPSRVQWLPTVDSSSGTVELRAELPASLKGLVPGQLARVRLSAPLPAPGQARTAPLLVPAQAVVRRAEMTGLYVLTAEGRPLLRQVRLGESRGSQIEILSGLQAGERVALEPQAAARVR